MFITKKYRKIGLAMLISLVVMLILNNLVLKEMLERVRPFYIFDLEGLLADKQMFIDKGRLDKFELMVENIKALTAKYPEMAAEWVSKYNYPDFVEKLTSFSFPSGHTSSAFAAAIAVLWYDRKFGIPLTVFAAIMGFSRIYVQVHYCTDVIGAAFVGVVYALVAVLIAKYLFPIVDNLMDKAFGKIKALKS
jgi:membrane-associated phospholipid phosphatase